jgi:nitrite reductase/ring-hydroxylating ferredoxin subunit
VALTREIPAGGAPIPVRLLGEDLVLFRDESGQPGLLGIHCAHRGADLSYGRLEDGGLRCIYHGWLYDVQGHCLEQPGEPAGSTFHERIRQTAYPCAELGDLILTYMGEGTPPPLPLHRCLTAPVEHRHATKWHRDCNWLQGMEGTLDPQHHGYLHRMINDRNEVRRAFATPGAGPTIEVEEGDGVVRVMAMFKVGPDRQYVRQNKYMVPNVTVASSNQGGYSLHWSVPIDDTHFWMYDAVFNLDPELIQDRHERDLTYKTPDFQMKLNLTNRYGQDREAMKTGPYCGIAPNNQTQDGCVIEGAGPIQDRTQEHLVYIDRGITAARKALLRAVQQVQAGEPVSLRALANPTIVAGVIPATDDWQEVLKRMERDAVAGGR